MLLLGLNLLAYEQETICNMYVRLNVNLIAFQHLAYEYAKRSACLVLVARREDLLRVVADKAKKLGSPDVLVVKADVSNTADCKNFVEQTINHFHKCKECITLNFNSNTYIIILTA